MGQAKQKGEIAVKCNKCGKQSKVPSLTYYQKGGFRGGCCQITKTVHFVTPEGVKSKREIQVGNTWSTVPAGKLKNHKPSRDRVARSSRK